MFLQNILMILSALGMISYVSPWFLIALIPLLICFVVLNMLFTSGVRELKRMDMITRSPILSHVTASVQGISTIHAYGKQDHFMKRYAVKSKNKYVSILDPYIAVTIDEALITINYRETNQITNIRRP